MDGPLLAKAPSTTRRTRMARFTRREMLLGSASGLATLGLSRFGFAKKPTLPKPWNSGIEHIVVVMVENRSFDHLLGWLPGAEGMQDGLVYPDATGALHPTHALAPDFQGCAFSDPDHSQEGGLVQLNDGACDGWLLTSDQLS